MKKLLWKFVFIALAVFIVVNIFNWANTSLKTEIAMSGILEKSYTFDGIIIRDETVIASKSKGVLEAKVSENETVKKNKLIGSVYYGDMDDETQKKLVSLNRRIAEINASQASSDAYTNDIYKIESNISSKTGDMIIAANAKDIARVSALKSDINVLIDKKNAVSGENTDAQTTLENLKQEKQKIESMYNATKDDLYSTKAGCFSTAIDGYEQILSPKSIEKMTVEDYTAIKKSKPEKEENTSNTVCKIINNFEWNIAILASDSLISEITDGQNVYIRFENQKDITAQIAYISPQDNGKYVVGIKSTSESEYAMKNRFAKFELITAKYSGLKVPVDAIRVKSNNQKGVYTVSNSVMRFKNAKVLYNDGKYVIIEEKNNENNYLLLYDEIIISDSDCKDGKRVDKR